MTKKTEQKENAEFDFRTITSFEDACKKENFDPSVLPDVSKIPEEFRSPLIAFYKLMVEYKAVNKGKRPDWSNYEEFKYFPFFRVLSSGFGFSFSSYLYVTADTCVGSRLCTDTSEKALFMAKTFEAEYKDVFLYPE